MLPTLSGYGSLALPLVGTAVLALLAAVAAMMSLPETTRTDAILKRRW